MLFPSRDVRKSNKTETGAGAYVGAGDGKLSGSKLTGTIIFIKYYNFIYFMGSILNSSNTSTENKLWTAKLYLEIYEKEYYYIIVGVNALTLR